MSERAASWVAASGVWVLVILAAAVPSVRRRIGSGWARPARRPGMTPAELLIGTPAGERVTPLDPRRPCRCGCPPEVHDHLRDGSDCGHCGKMICRAYRPDLRAVAPVVSPATVGEPAGDVEDTFAMWPDHADVNDLDVIARLTRDSVSRERGISTS